MSLTVRLVDYQHAQDAAAMMRLLNEYALDPMGGGEPLDQEVLENLPRRLAEFNGAFSVIAERDGEPVGLINCLPSFSTFKCKPIVNIHDVTVSGSVRGQGVCSMMLARVEKEARDRGCCKLTLEVLDGNHVARRAYEKVGFTGYELDSEMGKALFWEKMLPNSAL